MKTNLKRKRKKKVHLSTGRGTRDTILHIRMPGEKKNRWQAAAEASGLTLTAWVEKYCDQAAAKRAATA